MMWRDLARQALILLRFIDSPQYRVEYWDRQPKPDQLPDGLVVVVEGDTHPKWACLRCPGGCGNRFQLPLNPARRPRWSVSRDWLNRPSIDPSVLQRGACGAHFWITGGRVLWCADSMCREHSPHGA
jgi:hypothetical protein